MVLAFLLSLALVDSKIIELSGIELQKLRINLQKMQQQNSQLAQANSQMLAVPILLIISFPLLLKHVVNFLETSDSSIDALVKLTYLLMLQELNLGKDRVS